MRPFQMLSLRGRALNTTLREWTDEKSGEEAQILVAPGFATLAAETLTDQSHWSWPSSRPVLGPSKMKLKPV